MENEEQTPPEATTGNRSRHPSSSDPIHRPKAVMSHRLFAGCPLPESAALRLHEWASEAFSSDDVRLVRPEQMHVTLLFYPKADSELRDRLVTLTAQVEWDPLHVKVGAVERFSRSAIAVNLESADGDAASLARLEHRLLRPFPEPAEDDPLACMLLALGEPEMDRFRRMHHHGTGLRPHLTVARARHGWKSSKMAPPPALEFGLDRLVLFESVPTPEGSAYTVLAQSGRPHPKP